MQRGLFYKFNHTLFILILGLFTACLPQQKETACGDNEAFDSNSRSCVAVSGSTSNNVFIRSKTPANSYTTSTSSSATSHSISVSDSYAAGYTSKWILSFTDGSTTVNDLQVSTNVVAYSFDPASYFGAGNYVLEAQVYSSDGSTLLDNVTWSITVTSVTSPSLTSASPAGNSYSYSQDVTSATHTLNITNPAGVSGDYTWRMDGSSVSTGSFTAATSVFSYTFDPSTYSVGLHTLELVIDDGASSTYDSYYWTLNIMDPDLPSIVSTTPSHIYAIQAVDGLDMAVDGGYLESPHVPVTNQLNTICVTVDDPDKNSDAISDIDVEFAINGVVEHNNTFPTAGPIYQYCYSSFSAQNLAISDVSEAKTLSISIYEAGSSNLLDYRNFNLTVRPQNIRPVLSIDSADDSGGSPTCSSETSTAYSSCAITQSLDDNGDGDYADTDEVDNTIDLVVSYSDSDISAATDYEVYFEIKKSTDSSYNPLDGSNQYSNTDCYPTTAPPADKLTCALNFDAYTTAQGHIAPGTYQVRAFLRDNGSTFAPADQKDSNYVTWEYTVTETQNSASSLSMNTLDTSAPITADSPWVELSDSSGTATGTVAGSAGTPVIEGGWYIFHLPIKDLERDDLSAYIEIQNGTNSDSYSTLAATQSITRTEGAEYYEMTFHVQIPQWVVTATNNENRTFRVTVNDSPDAQAAATPLQFTGTISVDNYNPAPTFADNSNVILAKNAFAGLPFTVIPPAYSDASSFDGTSATWQWQISTDGTGTTWTDIPDADESSMTSTTLVWTPDSEISSATVVWLRLCLGDDGYGNSADCSSAAATKTYEDITVYPNNMNINDTTDPTDPRDGDEIATWLDSSTNFLYMAYPSSGNIIVKKYDAGADTLDLISSISFASNATGDANVNISDLSIDGLEGEAIIMSYLLVNSISSLPEIMVRRIDIENDILSFHYEGIYDAGVSGNQLLSLSGVTEGSELVISDAVEGALTIDLNAGWAAGDYLDINGACFYIDSIAPGCTEDVVFCSSDLANCNGSPTSMASELASAINSSTSMSPQIYATAAADVVTIYGLPSDDWHNSSIVTNHIGKIQIDPSTGYWYVPYIDLGSSSALAYYHQAGSVASAIGSGIPGITTLSTSGSNHQELTNVMTVVGATTYMINATKNSSGNMNIYIHDTTGVLIRSTSSFFNLSSYDELSEISIDTDGTNIWVSGLGMNTSLGYLQVGVLDFTDFTNYTRVDLTTYTNERVSDLFTQQIKITSNSDEAVIGVITSDTNTLIQEAHMIKVVNTGFGGSINLYDYASPQHNSTSPAYGISPRLSLTDYNNMSYANAGDTAGENTKDMIFFTFFEDNSGTVDIRTSAINIEGEAVSDQTGGVSGSAPAFFDQ